MTGPPWARRIGAVVLPWLRRGAHRIVLAVAGLVTALVLLALAGAAADDAAVDADTGRTVAEVLSTAGPRTVVRFATPDGEVRTPEQGVAYPSGLVPGRLVRVEYAEDDPELVRVAGRSWVVGLAPALLVIGPTWLVAAPSVWWLRRRPGSAGLRRVSRMRRRGDVPRTPGRGR
ncbi:MAG: DUF3592 domain-containing protein [Pseudonocardiaceae bacterium]